MNWIFIVLAILAGMALPLQGAINSKLASFMHNPFLSALISFTIGTIALLIYVLVSRIPLSQLSGVREAPMITWIGGLLGAFFITTTLLTVPKLGVALTFSLVILGQMIVTLPMDHFGLLGVMVRSITWPRILGVVLVIAGTILIRRY
ncbi:MAG TPA: DMT family transporter [Saprospiraceae bacterium]|nr:DMT family transporter [Saprospiraceae bacterium]